MKRGVVAQAGDYRAGFSPEVRREGLLELHERFCLSSEECVRTHQA